jgi:hypothetical protein
MKKYTIQEFLKAAEIGEVSMIDARHTASLLDEARQLLESEFDCRKCKNSFSNPFDQYYCTKTNDKGIKYDIENGEDCGGKLFEI